MTNRVVLRTPSAIPRLVAGMLCLIVAALAAAPAEASNEALLRLLQVLRDRGSITSQEYDEIRRVAEATAAPQSGPSVRDAEQDKAIADLRTATTGTPAPVVGRALAGKWYERLTIRGYSQMRYSEVEGGEGPALEIPNDRSANANESFVLRRGRVVISGDVADHLSLYAQTDFAGSLSTGDFALQMRDLYGDIWLDKGKQYRVRVGQSKVPFGFANMQSSSNRAAFERPDAINSAVEGERDLGALFMWTSPTAKQRFRELGNVALKGTGDYGVFAAGLFAGQGLNRADQNGNPHLFLRAAYPFRAAGGQYYELAVQAYRGRFVSPTAAVTDRGTTFTPSQPAQGVLDQRVAITAVLYPQPLGIEAEWTMGSGPQLSTDARSIAAQSLQGGHVQVGFRSQNRFGTWYPFARWNYFDGARKFARNAPADEVNEVDLGVEFIKWAEVELTGMMTRTFRRTRTSAFPFGLTRDTTRFGLQVQWNY